VCVCARACCLRLSIEPQKEKVIAKGKDIAIEALVDLIVYDGVGYFSNKCGFSVTSSLQGISSNSLLWKRNNLSVVT